MSAKAVAPIIWLLVKRFFGGRTFEEAFAIGQRLHEKGFGVIFNCVDYEDMDLSQFPGAWYAIEQEYRHAVYEIAQAKLSRGAVSIKPSQFGLHIDTQCAETAILRLVEHAGELRVPVEFDMEHAADIDATLKIFTRACVRHPLCRLALQACHSRTAEDLARLISLKARVRWVEGAYKGDLSGTALQRTRREGAHKLLEYGKDPAFAVVRNEKFMAELEREAATLKKPLHIQMLYGFRPRWQERLLRRLNAANQGHRVDIYIPYGKDWLPYGMRRATSLIKWLPNLWKIYRD